MVKFENIWREQCEATIGIRARYGEKAALDYLVGEKLLLFTATARNNPAFATQLPPFVARVRQMFPQDQISEYLYELEARLIESSHSVGEDDGDVLTADSSDLESLRQIADLLSARTLGTA